MQLPGVFFQEIGWKDNSHLLLQMFAFFPVQMFDMNLCYDLILDLGSSVVA